MRLPLPSSDPTLAAPAVLDTFALVPECARKIEPVGKFYAELQYRIVNNIHKQTSSDEEDKEEGDAETDAHANDYAKKKKTRTKEDIEKEALLMENLYATLGLEAETYEATEL
jgi:hypothetical protein